MNKIFPHAVKVVRAAIASSGNDPAAAIVHALNAAGMLVDPEKSYGAVVDRAQADRPREHQEQPDLPARRRPQATELEEQALAWDQACAWARDVAGRIKAEVGQHPAFQNLQVDGDRILVALHIVNQAQWAEWRRYLGIQRDGASLPYMVAGDGYRDGVRVSVVAYDLPEARAHALRTAKAPFELEGIVYDLALPQRDAEGDVWYFQGQQAESGMPLLSMDGRPERCSLANLIQQKGPLTPVTESPSPQATPVTTGGESA
ncbi:BN159_2729 family protein [Streptomyces sp. NPDC048288]|uniref:BN159_2729 family protein n=1 Tax=Streptomyces sp. NPDC048288 TaxID=3365529 RepID=UPI003720A358